jgi:hypothetical protein
MLCCYFLYECVDLTLFLNRDLEALFRVCSGWTFIYFSYPNQFISSCNPDRVVINVLDVVVGRLSSPWVFLNS